MGFRYKKYNIYIHYMPGAGLISLLVILGVILLGTTGWWTIDPPWKSNANAGIFILQKGGAKKIKYKKH